jgi:pseudouridine-5'-phosphate glycosidase
MNQNLSAIKEHLEISREVGKALMERRPLVALESTVIAHGLPHPINLEVAARMEANVREGGATPATIAILDGKIHIGLSQQEIERIATANNIQKASTRDIPLLLTRKGNGATTVSATIRLAALVGIKVFATGGIGGVHRGWEQTFDISPDLSTLAGMPLVPVLGYRTDRFPAFYTPVSDPSLPVDARVDTPHEVAAIYDMRQRLGMRGGVLLCVPVPALAALSKAEVAEATDKALKAAAKAGVKGRDVTPFLLNSFAETTGGRSLTANRALLENNATVAAEISKAITPVQYV